MTASGFRIGTKGFPPHHFRPSEYSSVSFHRRRPRFVGGSCPSPLTSWPAFSVSPPSTPSAGTTATDAALRFASSLPAAVEAVRAVGEDALIAPPVRPRTAPSITWPGTWNLAALHPRGRRPRLRRRGASRAAHRGNRRRPPCRGRCRLRRRCDPDRWHPHSRSTPVLCPLRGRRRHAARRSHPTAVTHSLPGRPTSAPAPTAAIVLPEPDDDHAFSAAAQVLAEAGIADHLRGRRRLRRQPGELGLDLSAAQVAPVDDPAYLERYAGGVPARLRAKKGVTSSRPARSAHRRVLLRQL